MATPFKQVQPVVAYAASHLDDDLSLAALADQAGLSAFHLHRVFSTAAGEPPKQFTQRLRLECAAVMLLAGDASVLDVALACGFESHEVFCRAFRRRWGMTPSAYRARGFVSGANQREARQHAALVKQVGPCIRLYHHRENERPHKDDMAYSITKKEASPQPVLVVRRRVKPSEIAATIAEVLPRVFLYAQQHGLAIAGPPFARYPEWGPGLLTIEPGFPVTAHAGSASADDVPREGDVRPDTLPGGFMATTTHAGPYDKLTEAHAAIQQWIEAQGLVAASGPWESYVTDPADFPDPKDWKTEVFWPLAR